MNTRTRTPFLRRFAAMVLSSALAAIALPTLTTAADDPPADPPASPEKKLPALPLTATFGKGTPGENGGVHALTLKNTSDKAITLNATIHLSVLSHSRAKTIVLPPHEIVAGGTWVINDLSFDDRIIVSAEGFAKLDLKTPAAK
jgi:hypothetical protein